MTPLQTNSPAQSTADKMKSVRAASDQAPAGPTRDAALKHSQAAGAALPAKNDGECIRELDAAQHVLA